MQRCMWNPKDCCIYCIFDSLFFVNQIINPLLPGHSKDTQRICVHKFWLNYRYVRTRFVENLYKEQLRDQTGLSINQISNWMANTRRRQKARPKRSASPSIRPSTEAINIPPGRTWDDLSMYPSSTTGSCANNGRFLNFRVAVHPALDQNECMG